MKRILHFLLIFLLFLLIIVLAAMLGTKTYLQSDKVKIIRNIPVLNQGEIHFQKLDIDFRRNYPFANFTLHHAKIFSPDKTYTEPVLSVDSLRANVEIKNLWKRDIELNQIELLNGNFSSITNLDGNSNLGSLLNGDEDEDSSTKPNKKPFLNFSSNPNSNIIVKEFDVHIIDSTKQKNLKVKVNEFITDVQVEEDETVFTADLSAFSHHLTFNWNKGPYLEKSKLNFENTIATIYADSIIIEPNNVSINEEDYTISANIYPNNPKFPTLLKIRNDESIFPKIRSILPYHIQEKLGKYNVDGTIKTDANILFVDSVNPIASIDFEIPNNTVTVNNKQFYAVDAAGEFRNRKYKDERALQEGKENIRLEFDYLNTNVDGFQVNSPEGLITFTPEENALVYFPAEVRGKAKQISQYFANEPYQFVSGDVYIKTMVEGSLVNTINIIEKSNAEIEFSDIEIFYEPSQVRFPFKSLQIGKQGNIAEFELIGAMPQSNYEYTIDGNILQFTDLFKEVDKHTQSKIRFRANELMWNDFTSLFGANGYLSTDENEPEVPQSMSSTSSKIKEVLSSLQNKFQPELDVAIDNLYYENDFTISDFTTKVNFENNKTLLLNTTKFKIDTSSVDFKGKVDFQEPQLTKVDFSLNANHLNLEQTLPKVNYFNINLLKNFPKLPEDLSVDFNFNGAFDDANEFLIDTASGDLEFESTKNEIFAGQVIFAGNSEDSLENVSLQTTASIHAEPKVINNLFENANYVFANGTIDLLLQYQGNVESVEELIANSDIEMEIEGTEIADLESGVQVPLDFFNIQISENDADLNLSIRSDTLTHVDISSNVQQISDLIYNRDLNNHSVDVDIYSPNIIWENFQSLFAKQAQSVDSTAVSDVEKKDSIAIKQSILNALKSFNPTVDITIDQLSYQEEMQLRDITSSIALKDTSILVIDKSGFKYLNGEVELDTEAVLNDDQVIPFKGNLVSKNFHIAELMENMDYFQIETLKEIDEFDGIVDATIDLEGRYDENKQQIFDENTKAIIDFSLRDGRIKGMPLLDTIGRKILQKNRFTDVQLAPLQTTIYYDKGSVEIPFTEIQSNVLHAFVEGGLTADGKQSIWFTLPLRMLFHPGFECVPEKTGNAQGRNRIFIELLENEEGELKTKIHLSKKKFFEQRGREEEFKDYKQLMREERKARKNK